MGYSRKNPHPPTDGISENLAGGGFKGLGNPDGRGGETLNPRLRGFILSDRCSMTSMCFDHFNVLILFSNFIILRTVKCLPHSCKFPSTGSICNFIIEKKNECLCRADAYANNAWNFLMWYPGHLCIFLHRAAFVLSSLILKKSE